KGGLVVYDDIYAYSHHATDRLEDYSYNSFDLYRVHMYGHLDEGMPSDIDILEKPCYKEMKKLCETDEQVSQYYYEHIYEHSEQWMNLLEVNNNGSFKSNARNIKLILQNDENLKDKFAYNLLSHRMEVKNTVPWSRFGDNTLSDFDDRSEERRVGKEGRGRWGEEY